MTLTRKQLEIVLRICEREKWTAISQVTESGDRSTARRAVKAAVELGILECREVYAYHYKAFPFRPVDACELVHPLVDRDEEDPPTCIRCEAMPLTVDSGPRIDAGLAVVPDLQAYSEIADQIVVHLGTVVAGHTSLSRGGLLQTLTYSNRHHAREEARLALAWWSLRLRRARAMLDARSAYTHRYWTTRPPVEVEPCR